VAAALLLVALLGSTAVPPGRTSPGVVATAWGAEQVAAAYGQLPLSFEPNVGQVAEPVQFLAPGSGFTLFLTPGEAVLALRPADQTASAKDKAKDVAGPAPEKESRSGAVVRLQLTGANPEAPLVGQDKLPGTVNYFLGNDPAQWRTAIPTYARVQYEGVYPGINLVYYGRAGQLEYDFVVAPGADPQAITLGRGGGSHILGSASRHPTTSCGWRRRTSGH
jgi:hypothetical protein